MVASVKHDRDARLTLASLTRSGVRTVANGAEIVADRLAVTMEHAPQTAANIASLTAMLEELAAA